MLVWIFPVWEAVWSLVLSLSDDRMVWLNYRTIGILRSVLPLQGLNLRGQQLPRNLRNRLPG